MLVVGLLSISITFSVYTLLAAKSDGGPAVVSDYYQKGKNWNATARARGNGEALNVSVSVLAPGDEPRLRPVVLTVRDTSGTPVTGLRGTLHLSRPQTAGDLATIPLSPVDDQPGVYRQLMPILATGLWDVELRTTTDAGELASKTVRVEVY
jgi:nitrogen fixation protein FixH